MRLYYLDNPQEQGSPAVLRQLGLHLDESASEHSAKTGHRASLGIDSAHRDEIATRMLAELEREHCLEDKCVIFCKGGVVQVDVRDSADAWLRIELSENQSLTVPANIYRRLTQPLHTPFDAFIYFPSEPFPELLFRFRCPEDALLLPVTYHPTRELVCELCTQFFQAGWVTGTGGSISIRYGNRIYMTPSGVQKERIRPDELYVLDIDGASLCMPPHKPGQRKPKLSDCAPLFLHAYQQRNAGAVLHSHGINVNLVTALFEGKPEFRISHQEMIKGIDGHGYRDELVIPIIENTAYEYELADEMGEAIRRYPKSVAVLVRRHGMYVWGATWEQAKRHAECIHYLFDIVINMQKLGMDFTKPAVEAPQASRRSNASPTPTKRRRAGSDAHVQFSNGQKTPRSENSNAVAPAGEPSVILLDIEGTTTPITFVKDVLFPFAYERVEDHLNATWDTEETRADVRALYDQYLQDHKDGVEGAVPIPNPTSGKKRVLKACADNVRWQISLDRKTSALKQLQGHIWRAGYENGQITSVVFDDVPAAISSWAAGGRRVCIYSSGSREAQHLLFRYTNHGDLRPMLSAYFDTTIGHKRQEQSYREIALTLGVDHPSDILFVTDVFEEAQAAQAAGLRAVISVREGNAELPAKHGFTEITSFAQLA